MNVYTNISFEFIFVKYNCINQKINFGVSIYFIVINWNYSQLSCYKIYCVNNSSEIQTSKNFSWFRLFASTSQLVMVSSFCSCIHMDHQEHKIITIQVGETRCLKLGKMSLLGRFLCAIPQTCRLVIWMCAPGHI